MVAWELVARGGLKLHVLCSAIVAIYNANQDARRTVTPTTRRTQCNVPPVLEYPRISPCNLHARHQARHQCSYVIMLYARHRSHDDVSVAASIVLQPSDPPCPMQGPIQAIKEYRLLTPRWLCTVVSPSTLTRASQYGDPRVARGDDLGKMRWIHPRERRNKELTHPPASFKKPQLTARWCI